MIAKSGCKKLTALQNLEVEFSKLLTALQKLEIQRSKLHYSCSRTNVGGRVVRWCWVNFQYRGVLLVWIREGQGPSALAVGAGGGWTFFSRLPFLFSFSPSLGDGPI